MAQISINICNPLLYTKLWVGWVGVEQVNPKKVMVFSADPGFSRGWGAPTPKSAITFFAENCMKMKGFGPPGGGESLPPPGSANGFAEKH